MLRKEYAQLTRLQRTVNADVASSHQNSRWLRRSKTRESSKGRPKRVRRGGPHRRGISRITLQELRRRIYRKAKSDKTHRFWGIFVHVTKAETKLTAQPRET